MPIFASFVIFIIFFTIRKINVQRIEDQYMDSYWEKERQANNTRNKPLDSLNYLTIPDSLLCSPNPNNNPDIARVLEELNELSSLKIVNFTGISNTDLKLEYGTGNLHALTQYDLNYTKLSRALNQLGHYHMKEKNIPLAKEFFHYAIETGSDIRTTYLDLATIYQQENNFEAIAELKESAQHLRNINKSIIARTLQGFDLCSDSLDS